MVKINASVLSAVAVRSGAVPPGHLTDAGHVTVKPLPLASWVIDKLKPAAPVLGAPVKLKVVFPDNTKEKAPPEPSEMLGLVPERTV